MRLSLRESSSRRALRLLRSSRREFTRPLRGGRISLAGQPDRLRRQAHSKDKAFADGGIAQHEFCGAAGWDEVLHGMPARRHGISVREAADRRQAITSRPDADRRTERVPPEGRGPKIPHPITMRSGWVGSAHGFASTPYRRFESGAWCTKITAAKSKTTDKPTKLPSIKHCVSAPLC